MYVCVFVYCMYTVMHVCMCVCMYVYIYVYLCIYVCIHVCMLAFYGKNRLLLISVAIIALKLY